MAAMHPEHLSIDWTLHFVRFIGMLLVLTGFMFWARYHELLGMHI